MKLLDGGLCSPFGLQGGKGLSALDTVRFLRSPFGSDHWREHKQQGEMDPLQIKPYLGWIGLLKAEQWEQKSKGTRCKNHWVIPVHGEVSAVLCPSQAALLGGCFLSTSFMQPKAWPGPVWMQPYLPRGCRALHNSVACTNMSWGGLWRDVNSYKTCQSLISYSQKRDFNFLAESFRLEGSQTPASWESALAVKSAKGCSMGWQILFLRLFFY